VVILICSDTRRSIVLISLFTLAMWSACGRFSREDIPRVRAVNVPAGTVWAGGSDGGSYIDCSPQDTDGTNPCTVYDESTADIWMSGRFIVIDVEQAPPQTSCDIPPRTASVFFWSEIWYWYL
jgi:hypothetical protein